MQIVAATQKYGNRVNTKILIKDKLIYTSNGKDITSHLKQKSTTQKHPQKVTFA